MTRATGFLKRRSVRAALVLVAGLTVAACVSTDGLASFGARPSGEWKTRLRESPEYVDGKFQNAETTEVMKSGMSWATTKAFLFNDAMVVPTCPLPLVDPRPTLAGPPSSGLRVTWLGHSTTLIEIDGKTILTDPQWSERASPSTLAGPKRFHPPPLPLDALPHLDAVVISHDHYDHLDMATVRALAKTGVKFHVGLGVGADLARFGVPRDQIVEHEWWQESKLGELRLVSTPSRHFSGRGLWGGNGTLWTSWTLIGPKHRVFFSGDTGATAAHSEIGARFGPFDVALIEIGQFHPSWGDIHLGPLGALDAQQKLRAARLLPIHWSTFALGLHAWSEPAETVTTEGQRRGAKVLTPQLGEPIEPTLDPPTIAWWRALPPMAAHCPDAKP